MICVLVVLIYFLIGICLSTLVDDETINLVTPSDDYMVERVIITLFWPLYFFVKLFTK